MSFLPTSASAQSPVFSKANLSALSVLAHSDQGEWSWHAKAVLEVWNHLKNEKIPNPPERDPALNEDKQERIRNAEQQELERAKALWKKLKIDEKSPDYRRGLEVVAKKYLREISYLPLREQRKRLEIFPRIFPNTKVAEVAEVRRKKLDERFPEPKAQPAKIKVKLVPIEISADEDELTAFRIAHYHAALNARDSIQVELQAGLIPYITVFDAE